MGNSFETNIPNNSIYDLINNYEFSNCYETNDSIKCKLFDKN